MTSRKGEEHLESKIIIRNYPPDTTEEDLRIMFEKYGKIEDCEFYNLLPKVCVCYIGPVSSGLSRFVSFICSVQP